MAYKHTQNDLTELFIRCLKFITGPLIVNSKLYFTIWGHGIMHTITLIQIQPSACHMYSPLELVREQKPNIFYLRASVVP